MVQYIRQGGCALLLDEQLEIKGCAKVFDPSRVPQHFSPIDDPHIRIPLLGAIEHLRLRDGDVTCEALLQDGHDTLPLRLLISHFVTPFHERLFLVRILSADDPFQARRPAAGAVDLADLATELCAARDHIAIMNDELGKKQNHIRALQEELELVEDERRLTADNFQADVNILASMNRVLRDRLEALEHRADDLSNLLHSTDVAVLFLDRELRIRWFTPAMTALMALRPSDVGRPASDMAASCCSRNLAEDAASVLDTLRPAFDEAQTPDGHCYMRRIVPYRTRDDRIEGVAISFVDITERKRAEADIAYRATHDALTDLFNRTSFCKEVALAQDQVAAVGGRFAVLMLDLDRFKQVNDAYGHVIGDQLLVQFARRLEESVQPGDLAARLGGDEFAILLRDQLGLRDFVKVAEEILRNVSRPCRCGGIDLSPNASIGIALHDRDGADCSQLLAHADRALYAAKESGQPRWALFDEDMQLADDIPQALRRGEFDLDYQPILAWDGGTIFGIEALLRWNHPSRGRLPPDRFLMMADREGFMLAITRWVLNQACAQLALWRLQNFDPGVMSVNVTYEFLRQPSVDKIILEVLDAHGVRPDDLVLEINERTLFASTDDQLLAVLDRLKELGFNIALDDFGTGHASLIHMRIAAVGIIKIDREFVRDQSTFPENAIIMAALADLCHRLGKTVIVEGIETSNQQAQTAAADCRWVQGYLHAPPMTAAAMTSYLADRFRRPQGWSAKAQSSAQLNKAAQAAPSAP